MNQNKLSYNSKKLKKIIYKKNFEKLILILIYSSYELYSTLSYAKFTLSRHYIIKINKYRNK